MQPLLFKAKDSQVMEYNMNDLKTKIFKFLNTTYTTEKKDKQVLDNNLFEWKPKIAMPWITTITT